MPRKSTQVALGGVCTGLCIVLMFMTSLVPFATFAIPMLAGAMLIPIVVELGAKTAVLVYAAVSILSVFIVPDREAAVFFIAFLGYYPIVKGKLERIHAKTLSMLVKLVLFNAAVICAYFATIYLFGMSGVMEDMGDLGRYGAWIMLLMGNILFFIYDFALTRYTNIYIRWFRPRFLRRV